MLFEGGFPIKSFSMFWSTLGKFLPIHSESSLTFLIASARSLISVGSKKRAAFPPISGKLDHVRTNESGTRRPWLPQAANQTLHKG